MTTGRTYIERPGGVYCPEPTPIDDLARWALIRNAGPDDVELGTRTVEPGALAWVPLDELDLDELGDVELWPRLDHGPRPCRAAGTALGDVDVTRGVEL